MIGVGTSDAITGGAVVAGICTLLFTLKHVGLIGRKSEPLPILDGRAGFKDSSFWEKRFDKLDTAIQTVDRIIRENRTLTQSDIKDLRDLLVDIDANLKVEIAVRKEPLR